MYGGIHGKQTQKTKVYYTVLEKRMKFNGKSHYIIKKTTKINLIIKWKILFHQNCELKFKKKIQNKHIGEKLCGN